MYNISTGTANQITYGQSRINRSSYQGGGLRIGTDLTLDLKKGFNLYSNIAAALLAGRANFSRDIIDYRTPALGNYLDRNYGSSNMSVTALDGKLGASYTHLIARGLLRLDAGWMWVNYYSAIQIADSGHYGRTKESNFAVQGPFVGLIWSL